MPNIVRGALIQATWAGSKQAMIDKHVAYVEQAGVEHPAKRGRAGQAPVAGCVTPGERPTDQHRAEPAAEPERGHG